MHKMMTCISFRHQRIRPKPTILIRLRAVQVTPPLQAATTRPSSRAIGLPDVAMASGTLTPTTVVAATIKAMPWPIHLQVSKPTTKVTKTGRARHASCDFGRLVLVCM